MRNILKTFICTVLINTVSLSVMAHEISENERTSVENPKKRKRLDPDIEALKLYNDLMNDEEVKRLYQEKDLTQEKQEQNYKNWLTGHEVSSYYNAGGLSRYPRTAWIFPQSQYMNFLQNNMLQGWKLHVGANELTMYPLTPIISKLLKDKEIEHKIIESCQAYTRLTMESPYQKGKWITIYPYHEEEAVILVKVIDLIIKDLQLVHKLDQAPWDARVGENGGMTTRYGLFGVYPDTVDSFGFFYRGPSQGHSNLLKCLNRHGEFHGEWLKMREQELDKQAVDIKTSKSELKTQKHNLKAEKKNLKSQNLQMMNSIKESAEWKKLKKELKENAKKRSALKNQLRLIKQSKSKIQSSLNGNGDDFWVQDARKGEKIENDPLNKRDTTFAPPFVNWNPFIEAGVSFYPPTGMEKDNSGS